MSRLRLAPIGPVRARLRVPGDKSIGHRALLLNAVAEGTATVTNVPPGHDLRSTENALVALGGTVEQRGPSALRVQGPDRWSASHPIDCGNSGTTARLLLGILAPRARGVVTLTGDPSLSARPMARVVDPLRAMGAAIGETPGRIGRLPLTVTEAALRGTAHALPVASAQVASALLLAGLAAKGETEVTEPGPSRDHTARMLAWMGADLTTERTATAGTRVRLSPGRIGARDVDVPGDLSSAAPFLALAGARHGSSVLIEDVGLNPTRTGFLDLLRAFGAEVETTVEASEPEPRGAVRVTGRGLAGIEVDADSVPRSIDELPLVAVLGALADGETRVTGAAELRVKESDRIAAIVAGLRTMGVAIDATPDGFVACGPTRLRGSPLDAAADHRIGMALAIAAALADGESVLEGAEWVDVSYPTFFTDLARCRAVGVGA